MYLTVPVAEYTADSLDVALFHFNGANGSAIVDSSSYSTPVTVVGGAAISNAQAALGISSLGLDGTTGFLRLTPAAYLQPLSAYTIEFRMYVAAVTPQFVFCFNLLSSTVDRLFCTYAYTTQSLGFQIGTSIFSGVAPGVLTPNAWHHVAISVSGTRAVVWVDGVDYGPFVVTTPLLSFDRYTIGGCDNTGVTNSKLSGYLDEFRYSNGVSRYASSFTKPTLKNCDHT
jgi:hypothetical protein